MLLADARANGRDATQAPQRPPRATAEGRRPNAQAPRHHPPDALGWLFGVWPSTSVNSPAWEAHRDGDVVLAMHHHSQLDYLYFNYAFLLGLPLATSRTTSRCGFGPHGRSCFRLSACSTKVTDPHRSRNARAYGSPCPALHQALWAMALVPDQPDDALLEVVLTPKWERETAVSGSDERVARPIFARPAALVEPEPKPHKRSLSTWFGDPEAPASENNPH